MTIITVGSYIKIPKGTAIKENYNTDTVVTKRDSVAQVTYVNYNDYEWQGPNRKTLPAKVCWGSGSGKSTLLSNVTLTDAPAPRKVADPATKQPSMRQRMVKGTKWKLTQDAQVMKGIKRKNPHGYVYSDGTELDFVLPAGTEVTITGKSSSNDWDLGSGMWMPCKVAGYAKDLKIAFGELNKKPEQVGEAEAIPMFAIWDTAEEKYYAGYDYGTYDYTSRSRHSSGVGYTDKLAKAKKFKRLADARVHCLIQTGYYDNLPESWGSVPEWMQGGKCFDVPDTWEIVKYDKLTKNEIERIELVPTFKRSWRLRELTVKYSSTVRKVYGDLEKKDKLTDWSAIMMFKKKSDNDYGYWGTELDSAEISDINALLGRFGDDVKIQKGVTGFAVAIKDAMTATMIRMAYQGNLECAIIDFTTLEEVAK